MEEDPSYAQVIKVFRLITNRLEAGVRVTPRVNYLVIWIFAGHGIVKDGMQNMLLNQFDSESKFYKMLAAESMVRDMANRYSNAYMLAIFSSCR